ncbi:MAG: GntR family transcriptional regulator [Peptococcaceae bacterium]|nr:GntR family transcriptional regulator [Peptococcaceae bacterium]
MNSRKESIIQRKVLREDINDYLRQAIVNGVLKPGERIVETRIAKELGVSQAPIRESLRELELMGLIESVPFQGCYVKKLSRKDIWDAYQVRANLEGFAAKEAALRVTNADLKRMELLNEQMGKASQQGNVKEFIELDIDFHRAIFEASQNKLLEKLWSMVHLGQWTFVTLKITQKSLPELAQRHGIILEKLKNRDAHGAELSAQEHILEILQSILGNIEEFTNYK